MRRQKCLRLSLRYLGFARVCWGRVVAEGYYSGKAQWPKDCVPLAKESTSQLNSSPWLLSPAVVELSQAPANSTMVHFGIGNKCAPR